jgi:hypothetical protein
MPMLSAVIRISLKEHCIRNHFVQKFSIKILENMQKISDDSPKDFFILGLKQYRSEIFF